MATIITTKINFRNIDYFKFKKLVVDGNRDDYSMCSKDVKSLCDCVHTLALRAHEFDDDSDMTRFGEIITHYKQILLNRRIDPIDLRVRNGWWFDIINSTYVYSAIKYKPAALKETLVVKTKEWMSRHRTPGTDLTADNIPDKIEGPGLYVFKHKKRPCFQFVGKADKIFTRCADMLKAAFDGTLNEPLGALLITSMAVHWDFYFIPVKHDDGIDILRILENDVILKHDCIWPRGLNFTLHVHSILEIAEFRKSCVRHHWPPEADITDEPEINLDRLRPNETINCENNNGGGGEDSKTDETRGDSSVDSIPLSSDHDHDLPWAKEKAAAAVSAENGRAVEERRTQLSSAEIFSRKMAAESLVAKQSPGSTSPASHARKSSVKPSSTASKPPTPKHGGQRSPGSSRKHGKKTGDVSADAEGNTSPKLLELERPRSSLDGRQRIAVSHAGGVPKLISVIPDVLGGMTRSMSITSTTSIDSGKEANEESIKEAVKTAATGVKPPGNQVVSRLPVSGKIVPTAEEDLGSNVVG